MYFRDNLYIFPHLFCQIITQKMTLQKLTYGGMSCWEVDEEIYVHYAFDTVY